MKQYLTHIIQSNDDGKMVKQIMKKTMDLSVSKITSVKFIPDGILLNGENVTVRANVHTGDELKVLLDDVKNHAETIIPYEMPLDILYEDAHLIFINKASGVTCHPSAGHYADSLMNGVRAHLINKEPNSNLHLLGRLDKDTSGIVGFAKNSVAAERMARQREDGVFKKTYYALVVGHLTGTDTITIPMAESLSGENNRQLKMIVGTGEDKKEAITHYEAMTYDSNKNITLVKLTLGTGRTHQIRFHMSTIGYPLLGDSVYGTTDETITRACLHAGEVTFIHPMTGERINLKAKMPKDMH